MVVGILLSGGSSRRMGIDKASMLIAGVPCARRVGSVLQAVAIRSIEVGPGVSGLPATSEKPAGRGPLAALAAGVEVLASQEPFGPALVVACDLPFLTESVLWTLARWPGNHSVVPVVEGRSQPLCARWSATDLSAVATLVAAGRRAMSALLERPEVEFVDQNRWPGGLDGRAFADVDTPEDLERLGLPRFASMPRARGAGTPDTANFPSLP